jgi:hypothetical protein
MINTLAPRDGGAPIAPNACMVCVGEAAKWSSFYCRPSTLCGTHFQWWAEEKTYNDF